MRIQKLLAERGVASRRTAEKMVEAGRVTVNNKPATIGQAVTQDDEIHVDGKQLDAPQQLVYLMLHKPRGVITTLSDDRERKTIADLIEDVAERVVPAGRLDYDSEGMLLLSNDGDFVHRITHPSYKVSKIYRVRVKGDISKGSTRLQKPFTLDGKKLLADDVDVIECEDDKGTILITIHTGVNRQIRRMCEMAGLRVQRLRRVAVGNVSLGDLKPGAWRHLTPQEIDTLQG